MSDAHRTAAHQSIAGRTGASRGEVTEADATRSSATETAAATSLAEIAAAVAALGYELRRSWPRSPDHLLLDLQPPGRPAEPAVAGQWFRDPEQARVVHTATPGASRSGQVVLQPGGADRRLPALTGLLQEPCTTLVSHRAERRAVLREQQGEQVRYTKVVPLKKHASLVASARSAADLPLCTPEVSGVDATRGTVTTETLPGTPLHDLLRGPRAIEACAAAGAALAALHRTTPPTGLTRHTWTEEHEVTRRWERLAAHFATPAGSFAPNGLDEPVEPDGPDQLSLIHRDFHDKQVLVADDGTVGILDFDLMALGDPALDLANLLAHLDLRCGQGMLDEVDRLHDAVLDAYAPPSRVMAHLPSYLALARRRLEAVYGFRPTTTVT